MTPRAAAAVAAATLALGCGGESFDDGYREESAEIEAVGKDIGEAIRGAPNRSNADLARRFGTLADRAEGSVRDLEELDAPQDLSDERDALVRALRSGVGDLRDIAAAARAGDPRRARAAAQELVKDSEGIRRARGALDRLTRGD